MLAVAALLLTACGTGGADQEQRVELPPEPKEGVMIYAALNPVSRQVQSSIDSFNKDHTNVQIKVRDYSDENGPQRLLVELAAGRVPDIMEMRRYEVPKPGRENRGDNEFYTPISSLIKTPDFYPPYSIFPDGNYASLPIRHVSEDDVLRFEELVNNTTQIYWPNDALANIVRESIGPYFAGDKTLEETVKLVQNRVTLYVNENQ